ncbi:DNA-binding response OmpR family regulator [Paenibacillus anaericanus]|uniref:response regulator transcription factor n=1 Tax=Paenibacillus anaericanus TaxID=170367 RepID=UPI00277E8569|nr:response regulator transcription factor [Paenibacillus anaericanus]MDQ0087765.1 DNA-binding response OmpR family regulator [Paenibacillus anaericanus]
MKEHILWVEGNEILGERWWRQLEEAGYNVHWFKSGTEMLRELNLQKPSLVLLGTELEDQSQMELVRQLGKARDFPIMVMLAKRNTSEIVSAFELGANDVVVKSLSIEELKSRIDNLLRLFERLISGSVTNITYEDLVIELKSRKVYRGEDPIKLTPKEYELLLYLAKRVNTVCHRNTILQEVWGHDFLTNTNVVDVYIRHLRKKMDRGRIRKLIHTVRGSGYMLQ